jgi:hypothetical protein
MMGWHATLDCRCTMRTAQHLDSLGKAPSQRSPAMQVTGKKVSLFNRPLQAPAALDEVALTAEVLAASQATPLLARLSLGGLSAVPLPEEMARQASDPITISRKSSGRSG